MNLEKLIHLFQSTHTNLQNRAAKSVDVALVVRNWLFGWYIVEFEQNGEDRAEYGKKMLKEISSRLKNNLGRGFSVDNLELFRKFYIRYQCLTNSFGKTETVSRIFAKDSFDNKNKELSVCNGFMSSDSMDRFIDALFSHFHLGWSHYVTLLTVDDEKERKFYEIESVENSWSVRELKRQMSSSLYERLVLSAGVEKKKVKELSEKGHVVDRATDIIKNPYILEFLNLKEDKQYSEHELETAIIDKLETFLLELGKGFLFEARQKRFTFDDDHFYVDLVFYNRLLRSYVLVDLKRDKLTHQDLGQMQMYVNYFDRYVKLQDENPTIGILLCHKKNDALVELTLPQDSNIYASKYQLYLPSKEELKKQIGIAEREFVNEKR